MMMMIAIANNVGRASQVGQSYFPYDFISQFIYQEAGQAASSGFFSLTTRFRQLKSLSFPFPGPPQ